MRSSGLAGVAVVMLLFLSLAGSVEVEIANKTVDVKSLYFPGDEVVVKASFKPNSSFLIDPAGKAYKLEFKGDGENYTARFELKKDVVLGEYQVFADNATARFYVDSYSIEANYKNGLVAGEVKYFFVKPDYVEYEINGEKGKVEVVNGSFQIPVGVGNYDVKLKCGNAEFKLKVSPELEIVFLSRIEGNETVVNGTVLLDGEAVEANLSYWFDGGEVERIKVNGSFELRFANVSGELHIKAEVGKLSVERVVKVGVGEERVVKVEREVYFPGDVVVIRANFKPEKGLLVGEGFKRELEFEKEKEGEWFVAKYELKKDVILGNYTVLVDGVVKHFTVDFCELNASIGDAISGTASCFFTIPEVRYEISGPEELKGVVKAENGTFEIPLPERAGEYSAKLECGNARISLNFSVEEKRTEVEVGEFYFVGDTIVVSANFEPKTAYILLPSNQSAELEFAEQDGEFRAEYVAEDAGEYVVVVDNITKRVLVDDYSIKAKLNGSFVEGRVSWHYVKPEAVNYTLLPQGKEVWVDVDDEGGFKTEVPENATMVVLRCGNAELTVKVELVGAKFIRVNESYFVGEVVTIIANFKPNESYLIIDNETKAISFEERNGSWVYEFKSEVAGVYRVVADEIERTFTVDSCEIDARIADGKVLGSVKTNFTEIFSLSYNFKPLDQSGLVNVKDGNFEIELPENVSEVELICENSVLRLSRGAVADFRVVEFEGVPVNITINKGKIDRLEIEGDEVNLTISGIGVGEEVDLKVVLPFEIPEGMHIYYWKEVDGELIPINYSISEDRKTVVFRLKDGVLDEDGVANGVIVDPLKFYIPRFNVEREYSGSSGILRVYDLNGTELYDVKVEVNKGYLSYLAFVDSANLPSKPTEFPYEMIKFRVEGINEGDEVVVRISYPSLENTVTDNGVKYYKFSPETLNWTDFYAPAESNTVILTLKDGGFGDEDGEVNGVIEDDGGVGWVGYSGEDGASICRDWKTNEVHTYWVYVPSGDSFTIGVYDGDDGFTYYGGEYHFWLDVYYPNGTFYDSFNATSNEGWDYFTINTNGQFGWWKVEVHADAWPSNNGNYYGLNITGNDAINIKVNESWVVNSENFYGTADAIMVDYNNAEISSTREFWVHTEGDFKIAIYDPDSGLSVSIYDPDDNLVLSYQPSGNDEWNVAGVSVGKVGWYRILLNQVSDDNEDEYSTEGNFIRVAVNLNDGVYFKPIVSIQGRVLEDFYPLGTNNGEDAGIGNVRVVLFEDKDNDGQIDYSDLIRGVAFTDSNGNYSFVEVTRDTRNFIVAVDSRTLNTTRGLNAGYKIDDIWAEQTYQTEWSGSGWTTVKKFGGQDPERSDRFGIGFEHYTKVNLSNYNGESIDFGFSFEVITNTNDAKDDTLKSIGEVFIVSNVGISWKKVYLRNYYESPVVVCTYNLPSSSDPPAVVRIRNVNSYSFEIKIQNPGDINKPTSSDVHCIVMEEGNWTLEDGRKVEAHKVLSDGTNENNNWGSSLMEQISYNWSYTKPVVLGQVMSYNDSRWSVFWTCNGDRRDPPDPSNLYVGKHVGEDTDRNRNPEILGVIVVEAGSGVVNGIRYEADLGDNSIRGVGTTRPSPPPYSYSLGDVYSVGIATQNAMDGGDGGWAVLYGSNPITSTINLAIDEDQIGDSERRHTNEQVAYWVFNKSGTLTARIDSDKFCQGCLRQFISNSNAIAGKQRSYFVMAVEPNSQDSSGKWWTIKLNSSLGSLNITDEVELDGAVFNPDMSLNDSNIGFVHYDYSIAQLNSYSTQIEIPVGIGNDGIPFSRDEAMIEAIPKPEIEVYGNNLNPVIDVKASDVEIKNISIFGSEHNTYPGLIKVESSASNFLAEYSFFGLRANGSDPKLSDLNRTGGANLWIEGNNATIRSSIVAFAERYGLLFYTSSASGLAEGVISYRNGLVFSSGDNIGAENSASNVRIVKCLSAKASGNGIETNAGGGNVEIYNCTIEHNGMGNESGYISEIAGVRINANDTVLMHSLIRDNGVGVIITNYYYTGKRPVYNATVRFNSIYNNTQLGIDIVDTSDHDTSFIGDNVTVNDGLLNCSQPNCGVDYPVITYAEVIGNSLYVEGFVGDESADGSSAFGSATIDIYLVNNLTGGDNLIGNNILSNGISQKYYGEGWIYLGSLKADSSGYFNGSIDVSGKHVGWSSNITATTTLNANTSEFGPNYRLIKLVNLSAGITAFWQDGHLNVSINVKAYRDMTKIRVYWTKPENLTILSMSGDYNSYGNTSNVYWWEFNTINAGETKHVYLAIQPSGDYSLLEAYNIGVDPIQ